MAAFKIRKIMESLDKDHNIYSEMSYTTFGALHGNASSKK